MAEDPTKRTEGGTEKRITVRDIARELNLHFTTVAEALRGSSRIKASTQARVTEAAKRMGYRPDPVLAALSSYRSQRMRGAYQGTLGWINAFDSNKVFTQEKTFYGDCYTGGLQRATSYGYKMEIFNIREADMSGRRMSQILKSRSIAGIIIGPMQEITETLDLEWGDLNSVRIGYSLKDHRITNVISDQFGNTQQVFEKLYSDGFRRIAFACPAFVDNRVGNKFSGGYLSAAYRHLGGVPVPPFFDEEPEGDPKAFLKWYRKNKPQVIMAGGRSLYYKILVAEGIRVPAEVQFVALHAEHLRSPVAGIYQNGMAVGGTAVDHLVAMIQRFKTGLETFPKTTMIRGRWIDDQSYDPSLLKK